MLNENERYNDDLFPSGETGGEYRYVTPQPSEPDYRNAGRGLADAVSPRYYYSESRGRSSRKRGGGIGARTLVALCLVFALLGGAGGGIASYYVAQSAGGNGSAALPAEQTPQPSAAANPTPVAQAPPAGTVYSASDVYAIGCQQTVGITTSVTSRNIFGQTTTNAVTGSGFIIRENGYILTNYHVIETAVRGGYDVEVMLYNGEKYIAEVVGYEPDNDVAVVKIDAQGLSAAAIGDSDTLTVGETVYAIGNPLGELTYTLTDGILSALDRDITLGDDATGDIKTVNMFQISAAVNSGNSGGPVYNARGEVVGVVTAKYGSSGVEGLGFAIPINDASYIANELIDKGYVSGKAFFGITVQTVTAADAQYFGMPQGAYVLTVTEESAAAKAGIRIGDVITKLGDKTVTSRADLTYAKKAYKAGDTAQVELFRAGETLTVSVTFEDEAQATAASQPQAEQPREGSEGSGGNSENSFGGFPFFR